jgi:DNA-binding response OmpR family regulator
MDDTFRASDYHVLVVDDDRNISLLVQMYLVHRGFHVSCVHDGLAGLEQVESGYVHLIILDLMMPGLDGWEMCKRIRERGDIPILMMTARGDATDKLHGFEIGADDYLVKPFDPNELVARTTSLLRRTYQPKVNITPLAALRFGTLVIDTAAHSVAVNGRSVVLTPREYQLLRILTEHPNQVLNRQQLLDFVWGIDYFGEDRVVDVFVKRLRQKLGHSRTARHQTPEEDGPPQDAETASVEQIRADRDEGRADKISTGLAGADKLREDKFREDKFRADTDKGKWSIVTIRGEGYSFKLEG